MAMVSLFLLTIAVGNLAAAFCITNLPERLMGLTVPIACAASAIFLSFVLFILLHNPQI